MEVQATCSATQCRDADGRVPGLNPLDARFAAEPPPTDILLGSPPKDADATPIRIPQQGTFLTG